MTISTGDLATLEMALSFGMNPDTSEPLTPSERSDIEARVALLKGEVGTPAPATEAASVEPDEGGDDSSIRAQLAALTQTVTALAQGQGSAPAPQQFTFEDVLASIDPRDSDASLAMFQWLVDNKRLSRIGMLDGGGYLLHYQEPKGTTKAGYIPGGTQGGRMVDAAVEKAKESGAKPANRGMCTKCFSVVVKEDDGTVALDDGSGTTACSSGGTHDFHAA